MKPTAVAVTPHDGAMGPPRELHTWIHPGNTDLPPVVLLHGSGQNENSILGFARSTCPDHTLIATRGRVRWEGGYAFFRRLPDRTLDHADLAVGVVAIQNLLISLGRDSKIAPLLLGYSNGAIAAAAAIINNPSSTSGAILLRPLSPAPNAELPCNLVGYPALLLSGQRDTRRSPIDAAAFNQQLQAAGALSTLTTLDAGHELTADDAHRVGRWVTCRWRP